jgi:hypothetical protein
MKKKTGSGRGVEVTPRDLARALAGFSTGIRGVRSTILKMGPKATISVGSKSKAEVPIHTPMLDGCQPPVLTKRPAEVEITTRDFARALEGISDWIRGVRSAILKLDPKTTVIVAKPGKAASAAPMLDGCAPAPMLDGCAPSAPIPATAKRKKR